MASREVDPVKEFRVFAGKVQSLTRSVFIGIDSGASGAIAILCGKFYTVVDIPAMKVKRGKKKKTVFILSTIVKMFKQLKSISSDRITAAVEEAQVGIPGKGNSAYNGFRVGCNFGMWSLFLLSKGYGVIDDMRPSVWKKKMGLQGKDKETSRYKAIKMFPKAPLHRKKDHDRAEALLIAEYLRQTRLGGQSRERQ